jgi:hypothetical protein
MRPLKTAGLALALASSGCLVSEAPLFDPSNASARPLAEGVYEGCEVEPGQAPKDCAAVTVTVNETGLYRIAMIEEDGEEEAVLSRFRKVGRSLYALQSWEGGDQPQYLVAESVARGISVSLILCADLPESYKSRYVARGELEVKGDTCVARSAGAVVAAAKAWARTEGFKAGERVVYTKKSQG